MKKLIISLVLVAGLAFFGASSALAVTLETEPVTASVDLTGNIPFVDVSPAILTWPTITLGTDTWVAANEAIETTYLLAPNGGIQIYTQNSSNRGGLQGETVSDSVLSTSWRVTDNSPTALEKTIYETVIYEGNIEETTGLDLNGINGIEPDIALDVNSDGDTTDYIAWLSDDSRAYMVVDTNYDWPDPRRLGRYVCYIWMKDDDEIPAPGYEDYTTIVKQEGIQHAEFSWGDWASSPIFVTVGANFENATPQVYSTILGIELYSL